MNGRKLTEIINHDHENIKYLPGHKLPENVVAIPSLNEAVEDADLLVFTTPHQLIHNICDEITGRMPKKALGITHIKGINEGPGGLILTSNIIRKKIGMDVGVLVGANTVNELAAGKFCEATIGAKSFRMAFSSKSCYRLPTSASLWWKMPMLWNSGEH